MGRSRSRSRSKSRSPAREGRERQRKSRSRSRSRSSSLEDGFRIHVADLGIDCDKRDVEKQFEKYGPLFEVWMARSPPCFAFIVYRHKEDAEDAIREMNGQVVCGKRVRVTPALPRSRGRRRRSWDPNMRCYQCGETGHFSRECNQVRNFRRNRFVRSRSRSPRRRRPGGFGRNFSRNEYSRSRSRSPGRDVGRRSRDERRSRSRS